MAGVAGQQEGWVPGMGWETGRQAQGWGRLQQAS